MEKPAARNRTVREVPQYLREKFGIPIAVQTLNKARVVGGGPPFYKFGAKVLYPENGLDEWAHRRLGELRTSTSQGQAA